MRATTGAAPVPVPPPMPQVTKTMSAPLRLAYKSSADSSAAFMPTSGLPPAPSPRVSLSPIRTRLGASDNISACASVLMATNSTPCKPSAIMRLTALVPPPPTPTTLIWANCSPVTSSYGCIAVLLVRLLPCYGSIEHASWLPGGASRDAVRDECSSHRAHSTRIAIPIRAAAS